MSSRYAIESVFSQLKLALKARDISYADVGKALGLSESGVKKMMANDDMSMARLAQICDAIQVDLFTLLEAAWKHPPVPYRFNTRQSEFFARHPHYFRFLRELQQADLDVAAVQAEHDLDQASITLYLGKLEDLGLITITEGGRIRSTIPAPYRVASPEGLPHDEMHGLLDAALTLPNERRRVLRAQLRMAPDHAADLRATLRDVVIRFGMLAEQDQLTIESDRLVDVGTLVAIAHCRTSSYSRIPRVNCRVDG